MGDLNLSTVGLITTLRTAPKNGSPSSSDYNEGQREILVDLASLTEFINNQILPLINALPNTALEPIDNPVGIEGRTIWSDTSDQSVVFFDALAATPLTLADSLRVINGIVSLNSQTLTDLGVEVASLQARLASTNQNDIALALQNLTETINSIAVNNSDSGANILALGLRVDALADEISGIDLHPVPFIGDTGTGGIQGLVPAPPAGSTASNLFLKADGTFALPAGGGTVTHSSGPLTAHAIVLGNGSGDEKALGSLGTANTLLHGNASGDPSYGAVVEGDIILADVTTNNVSTSKHGFAPKAPNDATKFLDGTGVYSTPTGGGTVITSGSPASGNIAKFSGATAITNGDLSGDVATSGTLATTIQANAITTSKINNGAVTEAKITLADNTTDNVSSSAHGFAPKSPADATQFLNGATTPVYAAVKDSDLSTSDITTNNVSITKHGFAPKAPNDSTKFLDGTGAYSVPPAGTGTVTHTIGGLTSGQLIVGNGSADIKTGDLSGDVATSGSAVTTIQANAVTTSKINAGAVTEAKITLADNTTDNVSISAHGFAPKAPNDATKYLDGTGAYSTPAGGGTVTTTGTPASGNLAKFSGSTSVTNGDLTGDVATSGTLATTIQANAITTSKINAGAVTEAKITLANNTTNDVTTSRHGFAPILPNDVTKYLDGTGAYSVPTGGGASLSRSTTPAFTTGSIANNASDSGSFTLAKSCLVYKVIATNQGRVRLYSTAAGQSGDASRAIGTRPADNSGLLVELILNSAGLLTCLLSPPAIVQNMDGPVTTTIYWHFTNLSGGTAATTCTWTILDLGA